VELKRVRAAKLIELTDILKFKDIMAVTLVFRFLVNTLSPILSSYNLPADTLPVFFLKAYF
jgi:hypothetical protein